MQEGDKTRDHQHLSISRARLDLRQRLAHCVPPLLLRNHQPKALKIGKRTPRLARGELLRPRGGPPLFGEFEFFGAFADDAGAGRAGEFGADELGEDEVPEGEQPKGHVVSISVLRSYRRLGLAKRLMLLSRAQLCWCILHRHFDALFLVEEAMASVYKASDVMLHVRKSNRAALGLYKDTLGFRIQETEKSYCAYFVTILMSCEN